MKISMIFEIDHLKSINLLLIPIKMFKEFSKNKIFLYIKGFKIRLSGQRFKLEFTTFYQQKIPMGTLALSFAIS